MITSLNQIDTSSEEGKLLIAAIAKITTESQTDKTPDEVITQLNVLKDLMEIIRPEDKSFIKPRFQG